MKVAIVVDSPKRDLDGALLVAYQLACRGVEAYLVPLYQQGYDLPWLQPDGVIVNYARENNRELLDAYRALGICVMVMDTEGGVLSDAGLDAPLNWAREMRRSGLARCVDRYFFWGPRLYEAFRSESGMPAEALHVTGCPRYDFCAEPWRGLLERRARVSVLINTNFSAINPGFTGSKAAEKAIFRQLGWQADYVERLFADLDAVFPRYLATLEALAASLPGASFRVRPHPFERDALYRERFARLPNVSVDGSGNVLHAIANAECVVHLNCGTAVESLMLGTPAVSLEFLNSEPMRAHAPLPARLSVGAGSFEELRALVADPAALRARHAPRRAQLVEELLRPWFHRLDGQAAQRVATLAIEALASRPPPRRSARASLSGSRRVSAGRLLSGLASNLLGSRRGSRLARLRMPHRAGKALALEEVRAGIAQVSALDGRGSAFSVAHARHPLSRLSLATIRVAPAG
jgi:surface carbohydrate biosynthesis protein